MAKTGDLRTELCDECGEDTKFYYEAPYPQTRETPAEPGGWVCQSCGWTLPDDYDYDPDLAGYDPKNEEW